MANYLKTLIVALVGVLALGSCVMETASDDESTTEQFVLPPPTTVTATVTSPTRITVSWTTVAGATKYYVYQRITMAGSDTLVGSVVHPGASLARANLQTGTEYCFSVRTVDPTGVGDASALACATTPSSGTAPPPPASVTATATSSDRITVQWTSVVSATKYYIYRATGSPTAMYSLVGSVLSPGVSFQNANLMTGTLYCYKVASENANGVGALSDAACDNTFVAGLEGYWKLNEGSGTVANDVSGWERDGTLTGGAAWNGANRAPLDNNPYAVDVAGGASDSVSVPDVNVWWFTGAFTLSLWTKVATTGTTRIAGKRAAGCGAVNWELGQDSGGLYFSGTSRLDFGTSLPVGTWSHVAVTFNNGTAALYVNGSQVGSGAFTPGPRSADPLQFGNSGSCGGGAISVDWIQIYSIQLASSEIAAIGSRPPPPTNLTATADGAVRVNVAWDAVPNASKYLLYKGTTSGSLSLFASVIAPTTSFSDATNQPSTTTYWQVRSVQNGLISDFSPEVSATTGPPIAAPTGVTATVVSTDRIRVDWNGVVGAVKYYIYESAGGGSYTLRGSVLEGSGYSYTAANLTAGVQYCYQIRTQGADSVSDFSSPPACGTP